MKGKHMDAREQLMYLLEKYYMGKYETSTFADEFSRIYDLETDYSQLSNREHELMKGLSIITARFSSNEEDLKIPNAYFSEKEVKQKATKVFLELTKK